jgi:hypothetical protein
MGGWMDCKAQNLVSKPALRSQIFFNLFVFISNIDVDARVLIMATFFLFLVNLSSLDISLEKMQDQSPRKVSLSQTS